MRLRARQPVTERKGKVGFIRESFHFLEKKRENKMAHALKATKEITYFSNVLP